jgi:hypothetical protein
MMKLLACLLCDDVFSLRSRKRTCQCKSSSGKYLKDNLTAEYTGPCLLLGFANSTYIQAVRDQVKQGDEGLTPMDFGPYNQELKGRDFTAFVIPESAKTAKRIGTLPGMEELLAMKDQLKEKD